MFVVGDHNSDLVGEGRGKEAGLGTGDSCKGREDSSLLGLELSHRI